MLYKYRVSCLKLSHPLTKDEDPCIGKALQYLQRIISFSKSHSSHRIPLTMLSETCTLFVFFLADSSFLSWTKVSLEFKADEVLELRLNKKAAAGCLIINYSYVNEHFVRE